MTYQVIAVTVRGERSVSSHDTLEAACRDAADKQNPRYNPVFVVQGPDGVRYPIVEQRDILGRVE